MKLNTKLLINYAVIGVISLFVVGYYVEVTLRQEKFQSIQETRITQLYQLDVAISDFLAGVEYDVQTLVKNELVRTRDDANFTQFLDADEETFTYNIGETEQRIIDLFNDYRTSHPYANSVYMGRENGSFVRSHKRNRPTQYDPRLRPWYELGKNNPDRVMRTAPYRSVTTPDVNLGTVKALVDEQGEIYGVVGIDVTLHNLASYVSNTSIGKNGYIVLLDDNGIVLTNRDQDTLFKKYDEAGLGHFQVVMEGDSGYTEIKDTPLSTADNAESLDPVESYVFYYTSPKLGWKICTVIPKHEIDSEVRQFTNKAIWIFALSLLLLSGSIAVRVQRLIVRPIKELQQGIELVMRTGRLDHQIAIKNRDEIGQLTASFNEMIKSIDGKEQELQEHREHLEKLIEQRTVQLSTLNEIGHVVSALLDVKGALEAILQQVRRSLPLDTFYVCLYDAETNRISYPLIYDDGDHYQGDEDDLAPDSNVSRVIKNATPLLINRSAEELAAMAHPPWPVGDTARVSASLLFVPLQVGQRIIGVISAQSYSLDAYSDEHLSLLVGVASQAAIAIENARLYDQVRHHAVELEQRVIERTAELQDAQAELLRQERLSTLGQLTATVAHEIRNPLGTVRSAVFAIGDAIERDELQRLEPARQLAERNIIRCDRIITELLDFTRERALNLKPTPIDPWLGRVLDEVQSLPVGQAIPESILCVRDLNAGVEIPIDGEHLRRAVINVMNNALDALKENVASPLAAGNQLTVRTRVGEGRLEMQFGDTGPGIPDDVMDRIFEPLFSTKSFGVGLGLPIVKNIMQQHGGGVEIQSKADEGTTVTLWLPMPHEENHTYLAT